MGGATALAVDQGQGKGEQLNVIFTKSMAMSFLVGVLLTLVRIFFSGRTMLFLGGASEATLEMARDYLGVLMSFSTAFLLNTTLTIFVRNDGGAPELAMWSMLTGSILNVV